MINANQITSRLRMMSDQELQRFAEMHKQDPYMFPLAFNESNMRKEMRSAPQGQGAAPQAPVNQQALAAMQPAQLPEDQGIGALNPNMQFADGGLVAFAGGGESTAGPYSRADDRDFGTGGVAYADGGTIRFAKGKEVPSAYEIYGPQMSEFYAPNPEDMYGPDIDRMIRAGLIPPPARRQTAPLTSETYGTGVGSKYAARNQAALDAIEERARAKQQGATKGEQPTPPRSETLEDVQTRQGVLEAGLPFVAGAADVGTLVPRLLRKGYDVGAKYINAFGGNLPREGAESARYRNEMFPNLNAVSAQDAQQTPQAKKAAADAERLKLLAAAPPAPGMPGTDGSSVNKPPLPPNPQTLGAGAGGVPIPTMSGGPGAARAPGIAAIAPRAPSGVESPAPDDSFVKSIRRVYADAEEAQGKRDAQREIEYLARRPEPESFKERKAALEEDRADVEKESRMNEGLAWLTFASKVVQPGKNTIQALVEGASAGGEQYSRAQKDLKKAEKERKLGLAALAEAERAAAAGQSKEAQARMDAMATRSENSLNAQVNAVAAAYGITQKAAYDRVLAERQMASQKEIAAAGNAATLQAAQMRNATAIDVANIGAGGRDERTQQVLDARFLADLAKQWNDPGQRIQIGTQYPGVKSWEDFVKVKRFELQKAQSITGGKGGASPMTPLGPPEDND